MNLEDFYLYNGFSTIKNEILSILMGEPITIQKQSIEKLDRNFINFIKESKNKKVYGVNTGLGPFVQFPNKMNSTEMIEHLLTGSGNFIPKEIVKLSMIFRVITLFQGYSGVRGKWIEYILFFVNNNLIPVVPEIGSLGASGDLIPLAHILATILFLPDTFFYEKDQFIESYKIKDNYKISKIYLHKKETLSTFNGLSVSRAYLFLNLVFLEKIFDIIFELYIISYLFLNANPEHIENFVFDSLNFSYINILKNKKENLYNYYKSIIINSNTHKNLQEVYSIRCVPQIFGAIIEEIEEIKIRFSREIFIIDDNPIFDGIKIYHTGNFYGQNLTFLATRIMMIQLQLSLWIERFLKNLYQNKNYYLLSENTQSSFGLAGLEILSTSLLAEIQSLSNFYLRFSVPTNGNNQDIVPLANHCVRSSYKQMEYILDLMLIFFISIQKLNILKNSPIKKYYSEALNLLPQDIFLNTKNFKNLKNNIFHLFLKR